MFWPYLICIEGFGLTNIYNGASDWPRTFLQPGYFCLGVCYRYSSAHIKVYNHTCVLVQASTYGTALR